MEGSFKNIKGRVLNEWDLLRQDRPLMKGSFKNIKGRELNE